MNRRNFMQSLLAGAAVVMLPALAKATETAYAIPMVTVADLTAWMEYRFNCRDMEPRSFIEHKKEDLPKLYGFSANDVPNIGEFDLFRIVPFVMAYACEGENKEEAEARLVQAMHEQFTALDNATPIIWRTKPTFESHQMTEYGDIWMTREQIEDRTDLNKEMVRERNGRMVKYVQRMPDTPLQIPEGVEEDYDTGHLKYVKRRYTLNKVRMRIAMPTAPHDYIDDVKVAEGCRTQRI